MLRRSNSQMMNKYAMSVLLVNLAEKIVEKLN